VVTQLALALDDKGFVRIDAEHRTSHPKIYAAGDLASHYHGALAAADAGSQAAHCINHELTIELVQRGQL
jgi:pyruvate/2-oxoglutarate dehydrogenase complex dihydrolipoamide dehydrogenase (E3) component